jgi:arginase
VEDLSEDGQCSKQLYRPFAVGQATEEVFNQVSQACKESDFILTIGGDHSVAIGSVSAVSRSAHAKGKDLAVFWIDAHADIHTPKSTKSGNIHGCPVSYLIGHPDSMYANGFEWMNKVKFSNKSGFVDPSNIVYIGLRDVEPAEMEVLTRFNIKAFFMSEIVNGYNRDIERLMVDAMKTVDPNDEKLIYVSLDVDGIDPTFTPSTGTPVPDGLTLDEGMRIIEYAKNTGRLIGMDVVEVNPRIGSEQDRELTVNSSVALIRSAFSRVLK